MKANFINIKTGEKVYIARYRSKVVNLEIQSLTMEISSALLCHAVDVRHLPPRGECPVAKDTVQIRLT